MKKIKKVIATCLACAMFFGTTANAMDYRDIDNISHYDSVQLLTELEIFSGDQNNNFNPKTAVTRGEMSKIIYMVLESGEEISSTDYKTLSYTDTVNHWSAPYVEYCTDKNIVSGDGKGSFAPDGNLAGVHAAKMLLAVIGFDVEEVGLTGANWADAAEEIGNEVGLFNGLEDVDLYAELNRDSVAKMVENALLAMALGEGVNSTETVLEKYFGLRKVSGIVVANGYVDIRDGDSVDFKETVLLSDGEYDTYPVLTDLSVIGKQVDLYIYETNSPTKGFALPTSINSIVTDSSDKSISTVAENGGLTLDADTELLISYMPTEITVETIKSHDGKNGELRTLIDNDGDKTADFAIYEKREVGVVTNYTEKEIVINNSEELTIDLDDVNFYGKVYKKNAVTFMEVAGKYFISPAHTVTGEIDSIDGTNSITIEGVNYQISDSINGTGALKWSTPDSFAVGTYVTASFDSLGNVALVMEANRPTIISNYNHLYLLDITEEGNASSGTGSSTTSALIALQILGSTGSSDDDDDDDEDDEDYSDQYDALYTMMYINELQKQLSDASKGNVLLGAGITNISINGNPAPGLYQFTKTEVGVYNLTPTNYAVYGTVASITGTVMTLTDGSVIEYGNAIVSRIDGLNTLSGVELKVGDNVVIAADSIKENAMSVYIVG